MSDQFLLHLRSDMRRPTGDKLNLIVEYVLPQAACTLTIMTIPSSISLRLAPRHSISLKYVVSSITNSRFIVGRQLSWMYIGLWRLATVP